MKNKTINTLLFTLISFYCISISAGIVTTRHNLSVSGPGSVKASSESEICVFCHTPHNASPSGPLWNRRNPGGSYTPYTSSSAAANPGNPTGASILCLSCHDGTIALGELNSRTTNVNVSGGPNMPNGPTNLTKDLSDDHPISFSYSSSQSAKPAELVSPSSLNGAVKLDSSGQLQCTSCHDAHDNQFGKFLVKSNNAGALCLTCHIKSGWSAGSHSNSNKTWNGKSVSNHACQSCHVPHSANGKERLLRSQMEESVCLTCHDGSVANQDIQGELNKSSRHPVGNTTGTHDPTEAAVVNSRHVECVDCHNPHAARAIGSGNGVLTEVRGVNISGNAIDVPPAINAEYQLCFRCHGDSTGKAAPSTTRQFNNTNVRTEFNTGNPSYHPVVGPGANSNVPSLINNLNTGSTIKCTDCHNNNNLNGPRGPHGSNNPNLLERQYLTQDGTTESASAYAMCYKCHSQTSILNNESFPRHRFHITGNGGGGMGHGGMAAGLSTPCNICHDPHGSQQQKLINFDTSVVSPSGSGRLEYYSSGFESGGCYLTCHQRNHNPCTYGSGGGMGGGMCGGMGGGGGGGGGGH